MQKYRILLREYKGYLEELVKKKRIKANTKDTYLRDANRIFESVISILPARIIEAVVEERGFKRSEEYGTVIKGLKMIVGQRKRKK